MATCTTLTVHCNCDTQLNIEMPHYGNNCCAMPQAGVHLGKSPRGEQKHAGRHLGGGGGGAYSEQYSILKG